MNELSQQEIMMIVNRYIGVSGGYLGDFTSTTHREFYPEYCNLEIDPDQYEGTTRERFIAILGNHPSFIQAKILRGVIDRFPIDQETSRTQALHDEIRQIIERLEQRVPVLNPSLQTISDSVVQAIEDAENLLRTSGAASAVDRVHTALHGYLKEVCNQTGIVYKRNEPITRLLKLLVEQHPALQIAPHGNEHSKPILDAFGTVLDSLNSSRNHFSLAHPNPILLGEEEAVLAINATRTILHYLDAKFH